MTTGMADLHSHTTASDGTQSPRDNVRLAKTAGLAAVAITDHDTVAGLSEALDEGRALGITVVPGVEISTAAGGQDIHILGYWMRLDDERFLGRLEQLRTVRDRRNGMIIERLRELGIAISMDEVAVNAGRDGRHGESVGRPHIADVLVEKGAARDMRDAFDRYLGRGGAAYVNPPRVRPEEAIRWIHEAGGAAVIAHPGLYGDDTLVETLIRAGLDGVEAFHSDHSEEDCRKYEELAIRHGVLVTAGSDFHGERNGRDFHGSLGSRSISAEIVEKLRERGKRF